MHTFTQIFLTIAMFFSVGANAKGLANFVRDAGGKIIAMDLKEASRYCGNHGMRIPTIRELAEWATENGAAGIRESAWAGSVFPHGLLGGLPPYPQFMDEKQKNGFEGYKLIDQESGHGMWRVLFYFNKRGYVAPSSDAVGWILMSNTYRSYPDSLFALDAGAGLVTSYYRSIAQPNQTVRCYDDRP